jgi:hypothetical protein
LPILLLGLVSAIPSPTCEEEDYRVEKSVSLTYDEATTLLDMALLTYANVQDEEARSVLRKLSELCRQFDADEVRAGEALASAELAHGQAA